MDSQPANHVVRRSERLIPRTDGDTPATTASPFPLVDCPEGQAPLRVSVPLPKTGIIAYIERHVRGWAERNSVGGTIGGTMFADRTELVDPEGDWFVHLKW